MTPDERPLPAEFLGLATDEARLHWAVRGLAEADPILSGERVITRGQAVAGLGAIAVLATALVVAQRITGVIVLCGLTVVYAGVVAFRWRLFVNGLNRDSVITISDEEARAIPDADLPVYTIFLPAFREPDIVEDLMAGIAALDYPRDRLDVQLLLEASDTETIEAARGAPELADLVTIIEVPAGGPQTKPKACNYGLTIARGEFCTIYDAEDVPEPLQLRRAVVAFRRSGSEVSCLQGRLSFHNDRQNLLTGMFTAEYDTWFGNLLPGVSALGYPLPLGGTSNHLRTDVLLAAHGWDPYNVTEDADLGIRLARMGFRSAVLETVTWEEANSDLINWVKQRSRWHKGFLLSGLVHLREPRRLAREIGWRNVVAMILLIPLTPVLATINALLLWTSALWWLGTPTLMATLFPEWLLHPSLAVAVLGNASVVYSHLVVTARGDRPRLAIPSLLMPLYWLLNCVAAVKATIQLITRPTYWEKTTHGLSKPG